MFIFIWSISFSDKIFLDNNTKATNFCLVKYFIAVHCKILFSGHLFAPYQKLEDLGGNVRGVLGPCLACPLSLGSRVPGPRVPWSPEGSKGGNERGAFRAHAWLVPLSMGFGMPGPRVLGSLSILWYGSNPCGRKGTYIYDY